MDAIKHGLQRVFEKLPCCPAIDLIDQLGDGELAGAVDADEQVTLAFGSLHLGDIDMEETNRVTLDALAPGLVAVNVW